ncbi:MAG: hypothetical protein ACP5GZ_07035 [Vulcanisaeta sp.]
MDYRARLREAMKEVLERRITLNDEFKTIRKRRQICMGVSHPNPIN